MLENRENVTCIFLFSNLTNTTYTTYLINWVYDWQWDKLNFGITQQKEHRGRFFLSKIKFNHHKSTVRFSIAVQNDNQNRLI
jgi:hypothetical protein